MRGYDVSKMLTYEEIDVTDGGAIASLLDRDEFNFSTNLIFSEVPLIELRTNLARIMRRQKERLSNEGSFPRSLPKAEPENWKAASSV